MKEKINFFAVMRNIAIVAAFGFLMAACSGGGGARPASEFSYDLSDDGQGIVIKGFSGEGGSVVVPNKIEDLPVVEIGDSVFDGKSLTFNWNSNISDINSVDSKKNKNAEITSITLPNTVTKIGRSAFANTAITKFIMPDSVTEIGESLFSGCEALTEVHLSDSIEEIIHAYSTNLFGYSNKSLKKINLPKNIKRIGESVFAYCSELSELVIPDNLTSVEFGVIADVGYGKLGGQGKWTKDGVKAWDWGDAVVSNAFKGCGKLPIKTRQILQSWGYKGDF